MQQSTNHIFTGMQQDVAISRAQSECLIDAHNIRITSRGEETLLSITNERGPKELTLVNEFGEYVTIEGTIIGHCVLNQYLVLFVHLDKDAEGNIKDSIFRIDMSKDKPEVHSLFSGQSLEFDVNHPIEAIGDYENENIQKVYWTDGLNQPRVINIMKENYSWSGAFDFVPELTLGENVKIERIEDGGGTFPAGALQYCFTYYNKFGQESNIFYTTPILYTSFYDRGASPETSVSNAFKIKIGGLDTHFEYLRIYSIMRTSINTVPTCKRVQDIELRGISSVTFVDNGTIGDIVDPTSLLYKGGEEITAQSICTKDGTLFLGNIKLKRQDINSISEVVDRVRNTAGNASIGDRPVYLTSVFTEGYIYSNGLNTQAAGFKTGEYYRIGFQAQYKNGKWSDPVFIGDKLIDPASGKRFKMASNTNLIKTTITYTLPDEVKTSLINAGYKKVRPVVVFPESYNRTIICQGVVSPTLYTDEQRSTNKSLYAQSSWFFRPYNSNGYNKNTTLGICSPYSKHNSTIPYLEKGNQSGSIISKIDISNIRATEIQGNYETKDRFKVDWNFLTFHSPDVEFDDQFLNIDLSNVKCRIVGKAKINYTASDIDIQTSSPTISSKGSGFIHKSFTVDDTTGIISGPFYDDFVVDDYDNGAKFRAYDQQRSAVKWMVYLWNRSGSLNNDVTRPNDGGVKSAVLSHKVISNLRYSNGAEWLDKYIEVPTIGTPQIFNSDETAILKIGNDAYRGNIDTLLNPSKTDGDYFVFSSSDIKTKNVVTDFNSNSYWWKTSSLEDDESSFQGLYIYKSDNNWSRFENVTYDIGDYTPALALKKEAVRMKYKSTRHITLKMNDFNTKINNAYQDYLPIVELYKTPDVNNLYGGQSSDILKSHLWIPAGKPVFLNSKESLFYEYGDTWYSRYDCLKTYPFTNEDVNKVVEIGSFMLETRINIDGRYDRNRGQTSNLYMSPLNFNLFNPVYSQKDNFFNYRILDSSFYELNEFPNQITWSTEKAQGMDVDPWTTVTLATTFDMDGSKGEIRSLNTWNDNIYCFQDNGVSNVIFNPRVQIPTSDGVPIEISNSYKVEGKRYISDGIGCTNKYSICPTPLGLYFIDSVGGHLQAITSSGLSDISAQRNMITWLGNQDISLWKPSKYSTRLFHDKNNSDIYITTDKESLCYSEILGQFTSFMSYNDIPVMFNVVDKFYCIKNNYINEMFAGDYNYFFGEYQGYDISFISNGRSSQQDLSSIDKIYTNINFRADKWSDKLDSILSLESPFDYVRVWNEYQDTGEVLLRNKGNWPSNLKKKFRVWNIQIPRDAHNRRDRIRNTWCKITLGASPKYNNGNTGFIQLHDIGVQFHI